MRLLFWNTHKNNEINCLLKDLVIENDCDVIILAEYTDCLADLLASLAHDDCEYTSLNVICGRINIVAKTKCIYESILDWNYYTIQNIIWYGKEILVVGIHLPSKLWMEDLDYNLLTSQLIRDIESAENSVGHQNTLIIGDFNFNPYENACVAAGCLHGIAYLDIARRMSRTVKDMDFSMFYNPMWNLLGDKRQSFGTYYFPNAVAYNTFWQFYDQVLLRPQLADGFVHDSLRIVSMVKSNSLLQNDVPNKSISDHLPIICELNEEVLM